MPEPAMVLTIDDDPLVRQALVRMLAARGFRTAEAEGGREGLALLERSRPDVILLDLRMPGMDGLDVLSELVRRVPELPVIVVSGEGTMADVIQALRLGAWDFVTKPILDSEILAQAVRRSLERALLLRENRVYRERLERANRELSRAYGELRADQEAGRVVQFELLPPEEVILPGWRYRRRLVPSQLLSGDFVDFFPLGDHHAGLYVADVAGHGAASAFVTAALATLVGKYREALMMGTDETALAPDQMLAVLNRDMRAGKLARHVTMFYGVLERSTGIMRYANAGLFPYPVLVDGDEAVALDCPGLPVGLTEEPAYQLRRLTLGPSSRLLLATDGVFELMADAPVRAKIDRLAALSQAARGPDEVLRALGLDGRVVPADDVAVVMLERWEAAA